MAGSKNAHKVTQTLTQEQIQGLFAHEYGAMPPTEITLNQIVNQATISVPHKVDMCEYLQESCQCMKENLHSNNHIPNEHNLTL